MTDNSGRSGMIGVLIGALIVIAVGGSILYATGALEPTPTQVTVQPPAATPAPAQSEIRDRNDRRGEWRGDRRDNDWRDNDRRDRDRDGDRGDRR